VQKIIQCAEDDDEFALIEQSLTPYTPPLLLNDCASICSAPFLQARVLTLRKYRARSRQLRRPGRSAVRLAMVRLCL